MIKAIIFDCFGVLVRDGWIPFREQHFGHDSELMQQAIDCNRRVDTGLCTYAQFIEEVAAMADISPAQAKEEIESNPRNTELLAVIRDSLTHRYKIGILSNAASDIMGELFTPEQAALFDEVVVSYKIGALKPNPDAYHAAAERLGVAPDECLFIDDQPHYCGAAEAVGMQAIQYQDNSQLLNKLKEYKVLV